MRVTTKGQVTIPSQIRAHLGIRAHSEVDFLISDGQVVLTLVENPKKDGKNKFARFRGILKGRLTSNDWLKATRG